MNRRIFVVGATSSLALIRGAGAMEPGTFPPVPSWQPSFAPDIEQIVEQFRYYTNGDKDFVAFQHGTCCIVADGLSDADASSAAIEILSKIINYHPDMTPLQMDDGNVVVQYREPAFNVVLADVAHANWSEIEARHQDGLTPDEVLITPLGQNVFDEFGKMALLGRSYMFMDAQSPKVVRIERSNG